MDSVKKVWEMTFNSTFNGAIKILNDFQKININVRTKVIYM